MGFFDELQESYSEPIYDLKPEEESPKDRETWMATRMGRFSGSQMHRLMTCSSRAKSKDWTSEKVLSDFGDTAKNYILEVALERATKQRIEIPTTKYMKWGNDHEAEALARVAAKFKVKLQECNFIEFIPNIAGATPDGRFFDKIVFAVEVKCPATLLSHYKLSSAELVENHTYFWQVQSEALALKAEKIVFGTFDPRFPEPAQLKTFLEDPSELHQMAIIARINRAEKIINTLIESNFTEGL